MKKIDITITNNNQNKLLSQDSDYVLKTIYDKNNKTKLTKEELIYLYDVYNEHINRPISEIVIIDEIISTRNIYEDMAIIFDCEASEVTCNCRDVISNPDKYVVLLSDFEIKSREEVQNIQGITSRLKYISGSTCDFVDNSYGYNCNHSIFISNIIAIGGSLTCEISKKIYLPNLKTVRYDFDIRIAEDVSSLTSLEHVGGKLCAGWLEKSDGLNNLKHVGSLKLTSLKEVNNLSNLEVIDNDIELHVQSSQGLDKLRYIGGSAYFNYLTDARSLTDLEYIGSSASFLNLEDAKGLDNLKYIGGQAYFYKLKNASALTSLIYIGREAHFEQLKSSIGLEKLAYIGEYAHFNSLLDTCGLSNLRIVGNSIFLDSLTSAKGLENIKYIDFLSNIANLFELGPLANINYCRFPNDVDTSLTMSDLDKLKTRKLVLPYYRDHKK